MGRIRVETFGGLRVFTPARQAVSVPSKKARALLACLAQEPGRPQPRGRLAVLLWGDSGEAQARASLRQGLLVLRRALELTDDELVAGPGDTLMLDPRCVEVDAVEFERLAQDDDAQALERAAGLYAGDFLEALDIRESAFEDWMAHRRHRLRERALDVLKRLLALHTHAGHVERATDTALRLLALDPLQEPVHRTLMQLYARQGRAASALRQFLLCRDVLARELGAAPESQTLALRDAIERQRHPAPGPEPSDDLPSEREATLRPVVVVAAESGLADAADPERAVAAGERFLAAAADVAAGLGGALERRLDGAATVLFGVPTARTDDAQRAARCALRLRELDRSVRAGVASGPVLVAPAAAEGAAGLRGDVLAGAARLAAAAAPGQVLVTEAVWRALAPRAVGAPCAQAALPAWLRPRATWQLDGLHAMPPSRAALVGRRNEVAQLEAALPACRDRGHGLTVHVRGEPGIGKTRLVEHFRAMAQAQGFACHAAVVLDFGAGAQRDAVSALVRGLIGADDAAAEGDAEAVARALQAGLVDAAHEGALHELLRRPLPAALQATADAMDRAARERAERELLQGLLQRCAQRMPRLLVVEDLHWAPSRTLAQVAALAGAAERCAAVLVTTSRSEGDPVDAGWRHAAAVSGLLTLDLGPLRWAEASALAGQYADAADPFTLRCVERAGGNPLFLEQLLGAGRDAGARLPDSLASIVQARLDALAPPERHALRVASVLGQRFERAALDHLLGPASWDAARAGGLLRVEDGDGVFAHALLHEGAYASVPAAQRRELHARAARWFAGRDALLHAEHLDRAGAAGAAQAYLEAAQQEGRAHRPERALALADRGLALAGEDAAPRFQLACCRAELLHDLGATADSRAAWHGAMEAAVDDVQRCRAWLGLAAVYRVLDDFEPACRALERAEQAAAAHGLVGELARIHLLRGNLRFPRGDLEGCRREHARGLALAREARSVELEAAALGGLGDAEFLGGRMLDARERFDACVALAQRHGLKRVEASNRPMAAITRWYAGDSRGSLAGALAAIDAAAQIGHRRAEAIAHHGAYQCCHALGDFDGAIDHAERALELARHLGAPRFEAEALGFRGEARRCAGQRRAALDDLRRALAMARATGMAYLGPVFLAMLALACDDAAERAAALAEGEALLGAPTAAHNHLLFRRDAIEACLECGDRAAALAHAAALERTTRPQPLPWSDFFIDRARAIASGDAAALRRVRDEGERQGQLVALAAVDAAIGR